MNELRPRRQPHDPLGPAPRQASDELDFDRLLAAARRQAPVVALGAAAGLVLALVYVLMSEPLFVARETILLDEERAELLDQVSALPSAVRGDSAVQSEVEILKSQAIALMVVDRLDLARNEGFMTPILSPLQRLKDAVKWPMETAWRLLSPPPQATGDAGDVEEADPRLAAAGLLRERLDVERVGRSYVIELSFLSRDAPRAAAVARAVGDAYLAFQRQSHVETTASASEWLEERVAALRQRSLEAKQAAQEFRRANRITLVEDEPLAGQELLELTRQLAAARSETAQAQARWEEYRRLLEQADAEAIVGSTVRTDTSSDEALVELRQLYLDTERRRARVLEEWGPDHPQAVRLAAELQLYEQRMVEEMRRAAAGVEGAYRVAQDREDRLRETLAAATDEAAVDDGHLAALRQLEQSAQIYDEVYQDFLERLERTAMQQSFPIASVRVLSYAETPRWPSSPRRGMALALGVVLGSLVGAGIGMVREAGRHPLRTSAQVGQELGLDFIGYLPASGQTGRLARTAAQRTVATLEAAIGGPAGKGGRVLGVAAAVPERSRTDTARRLAEGLAEQGESVLLMQSPPDGEGADAALRSRDLVLSIRKLGEGLDAGDLAPARWGSADGKDASAHRLDEWLSAVRQRYAYVILDLPPLSVSAGTRAAEPVADAFVLVAPWGAVTADTVAAVLDENGWFLRRCLGLVLAGTNFRRLRRYADTGTMGAT